MKSEGYVYVLKNKSMRGLVKIGRTTGSVEQRAQNLSSTGVPFPFEVAFKMKVTDCVAAEKWLHDRFSHKRVNRGKEFFRVSAQEVQDALIDKVDPDRIAREKVETQKRLAEERRVKAENDRLKKIAEAEAEAEREKKGRNARIYGTWGDLVRYFIAFIFIFIVFYFYKSL